MEKVELSIKVITKNSQTYIIEQKMNKWMFFKYPELKKDIKDGTIVVNKDFINVKDNTIFYNSKFVNYKKATV